MRPGRSEFTYFELSSLLLLDNTYWDVYPPCESCYRQTEIPMFRAGRSKCVRVTTTCFSRETQLHYGYWLEMTADLWRQESKASSHLSRSPFINVRSVTEKMKFDPHEIGVSRKMSWKVVLQHCFRPLSLNSTLIPRNTYVTFENCAWWGVPKPFVLRLNSERVWYAFSHQFEED